MLCDQVCGVNGEEDDAEEEEVEEGAVGEEIGGGEEAVGEVESERSSPDGRPGQNILASWMEDVSTDLPQPEWLNSLKCVSAEGQVIRFRLKIGRLEGVSRTKTELFVQIG